MNRTLIVALLLLISTSSQAQVMGHAENWYFGSKAGISFSTYPPQALSPGGMMQREGNATISDQNGNLLFYTNGMQVWNKEHALMKNGSGLKGQHTAAQSSVIVPNPEYPSLYYIFTISDWQNSSGSLCYSVVDITLDNGKGAIIEKNTLLNKNCREHIAAVYANASHEVWVLAHEKGNKKFVSYLVAKDGVSKTPTYSECGIEYTGKNRYGQLKFASNGKKLCATLGGANNSVQLFNFDQKTGKVSTPVQLNNGKNMTHAYSSEFSPNGQFLYIVAFNGSYIYQFDISSDDESTIQSSKTEVAGAAGIKSCLQIGHDQKIYVSRDNAGYVGVIHNPNSAGQSCQYENDGIQLADGTSCRLGFPNFIQSYFEFFRDLEKEDEVNSYEFIIHFDSNSSKVNETSRKTLDEVAKFLNAHPEYKVIIGSHTDCVGKAGTNKKLSKKRAEATDNYLQAQIGDKKRSSAKGYGESTPLSNCECEDCSKEEHAMNRRTTITIIK